MVTFHQSYSYEEFVEGIRPVLDEVTLTASCDMNYSAGYSARSVTAPARTRKTAMR